MQSVRIGLVLGAGGVVGGAYHAGVLAALAEAGWDARTAEIIVGTSAGSASGAALRCGVAPRDLARRAEGKPLSDEGERLVAAAGSPPVVPSRPPGRGSLTMSSPSAVLRAARRPFSVRPGVVAAALLPAGTVPTEEIAAGFDALCGDGWPAAALWLCAVRLRDGRLAVFGRDGDPSARIGAAVAASCAIPSFFAPVEIDGERYVDGGAHSPTNADLLARMNLDLVVISAPMAMAGRRLSAAIDAPARRWSRVNLDREARRIRRRGTPVLAWCPTPDDRSVMGLNAMDPARRAAVCEQARVSVLRRLERPDERFSLLGVA